MDIRKARKIMLLSDKDEDIKKCNDPKGYYKQNKEWINERRRRQLRRVRRAKGILPKSPRWHKELYNKIERSTTFPNVIIQECKNENYGKLRGILSYHFAHSKDFIVRSFWYNENAYIVVIQRGGKDAINPRQPRKENNRGISIRVSSVRFSADPD